MDGIQEIKNFAEWVKDYPGVHVVKEYFEDGMPAVDVKYGDDIYYIEYHPEKKSFRWHDFNVDLELGKVLNEAIDGFEILLEEHPHTKQLTKKSESDWADESNYPGVNT